MWHCSKIRLKAALQLSSIGGPHCHRCCLGEQFRGKSFRQALGVVELLEMSKVFSVLIDGT